jgi:two-component system response regulator YesN
VSLASAPTALVRRTLDLIQQCYAGRVTVMSLAKALDNEPAHLSRLFRDATGVSIHAYVTRARLQEGEAQIRAGVKIEAVALGVGYRSKKDFYRQFKRRFGFTPVEYRRRVADTRDKQSLVV